MTDGGHRSGCRIVVAINSSLAGASSSLTTGSSGERAGSRQPQPTTRWPFFARTCSNRSSTPRSCHRPPKGQFQFLGGRNCFCRPAFCDSRRSSIITRCRFNAVRSWPSAPRRCRRGHYSELTIEKRLRWSCCRSFWSDRNTTDLRGKTGPQSGSRRSISPKKVRRVVLPGATAEGTACC